MCIRLPWFSFLHDLTMSLTTADRLTFSLPSLVVAIVSIYPVHIINMYLLYYSRFVYT